MAKIKGELEGAQIENLSANPSNLPDGRVWLNTTDGKPKIATSGSAKSLLHTASPRADIIAGSANHVVVNDGSGLLSSEATLAKSRGGSGQDNSSLNFPASGTLATLAGAETLTNKTTDVLTFDGTSTPSNPSAGFYKAYVKDSTQKLTILNSAGAETTVGSGASGVNYILNPDAEAGTTGWAAYFDSVSATPTDGTGGSPNVTWTTSSTSPLRGLNSFIFTKDNADRRGQGVSYDFTIDSADKSKVLQGYFDYTINSGTYADNDLTVWIYDVTNAALIQPSPFQIKKHLTNSEKFFFEFQTSATSTSYRLIIHCASVSALAYSLKIDNFNVGPQAKLYGSPITDWETDVAANYTINATLGNSSVSVKKRRLGDSLHIRYSIDIGSTFVSGGGLVAITIPYSIDSSKMQSNSFAAIGTATIHDSGATVYSLTAIWGGGNVINMIDRNQNQVTYGSPITFATGDDITFDVIVPITGYSAATISSNDADTRVCAALFTKNGTQAINPSAKITSLTVVNDTHGAWDNANNRYIIKTAGYYSISQQHTYSVDTLFGITAYAINGGSLKYCGTSASSSRLGGSTIIPQYLIAGDYIEFHGVTNLATTLQAGVNDTWFAINKIQGPAQVMASEKIAARYTSTATTTIPTVEGNYLPSTKDYDTHNSYSASTGYTCPTQGLYMAKMQFITSTYNTASILIGRIYQNGAAKAASTAVVTSGTNGNYTVNCSVILNCLANDILLPKYVTNAGTPAMDGVAASNFVEFIKL